jgi:hypothetical protein
MTAREGSPSVLSELIKVLPLMPLGPGKPDRARQSQLAALDESAFTPVVNRTMIEACRAGLWLAFNFLDESHGISQGLETPEGSYWHALMHRREPDYPNSKYWFRQLGSHPVYPLLCMVAGEVAAGAPARATFLLRQDKWDPFAFVDLCESSREPHSACHELCRRLQRIEWGLLFAYCLERATRP